MSAFFSLKCPRKSIIPSYKVQNAQYFCKAKGSSNFFGIFLRIFSLYSKLILVLTEEKSVLACALRLLRKSRQTELCVGAYFSAKTC